MLRRLTAKPRQFRRRAHFARRDRGAAEDFAAIESERVQALTLLAASVAHEIGNPLNALHIHLQLMERELQNSGRTPLAQIGFATAFANSIAEARPADISLNWSNTLVWPKAKSTGWITSSRNFCRPSAGAIAIESDFA